MTTERPGSDAEEYWEMVEIARLRADIARKDAALRLFLATLDEWRGAAQVFTGDFEDAEQAARAALSQPEEPQP